MNSQALAGRLSALAARIDKECSDFLRDARKQMYDGPGSLKLQMTRKLENWRLELEALERELGRKAHEVKWQSHWRTPQSAAGKERELEQARGKLFRALGRVELTMSAIGEPPLIEAAKSLAELIKNLASTTQKELAQSVQTAKVPNEVKAKLSANSSDGVLTVVLGSALLWEWIKRLRTRK